MSRSFSIDRLHEQEPEIITRSQILRHSALRNRVFPMDAPFLPSKCVPILLVIINNGLIETPFQFFQRHGTSLCRCFRVMNPMTGVGQASFKSLSHPPKKRLDGAFCRWSVWGCLLSNDAKPIYQDRPGAFGGEN